MTKFPDLLNTTSSKLFFSLCLVLLAIALGFLGIYASQASDPYSQQVLILQGDPVRGHAIFQINCAGCHGLKAKGDVGPSLRDITHHKSDLRLIQQVISGQTPPMPKFQPQPQDMSDLLSYLHTL